MDIAVEILNELSKMIDRKASDIELIEASNRFYTMIPHTFAQNCPPVIKTADMIAKKMDMLKHLENIKLTYTLLNRTEEEEANPLDNLYRKLNADIKMLDPTSEEYQDIKKYLILTQDTCEDVWNLEIVNAFEVARHGEEQRFAEFKHLPNRTLLWHGSNLTNYVGILSNGLKIAPPDVPTHGYNFGKGLYFADAVAKSLNYCSFNPEEIGLLLLCEVALGNSKEVTVPQNITQLEKGINSVKCNGYQSLSGFKQRLDGLLIPDGKLIENEDIHEMDLNEYVVYNEAQARIKYLVMFKLKNDDDDDVIIID